MMNAHLGNNLQFTPKAIFFGFIGGAKVQATGIIEAETVQAITAWPSQKTDAGLPGPKLAVMDGTMLFFSKD